ncbi:MAG TPA: hypothetical protein VGI22_20270 [Xanthobacteraceae bacterium]
MQDGTAGTEADVVTNVTNKLTGAGFTVTNGTALPGSLNGFKEIWDLEFNNTTPLSASNMAAYKSYLQAGGSLFLDGENTGVLTRDNSLLAFIATLGIKNPPTTANFALDDQTCRASPPLRPPPWRRFISWRQPEFLPPALACASPRTSTASAPRSASRWVRWPPL